MKFHRTQPGFTLIELVVVLALVLLLSTLAVIALGSAREKARDAKRLSDLKQIQAVLELSFSETSSYPKIEEPLPLGLGNARCLDATGFHATCADPYMQPVPTDPKDGAYLYQSSDGTNYTITTELEGKMATLSAGRVVASPSGIVNQ